MDDVLLEQLLDDDESTTLDFKSAQYSFVRAEKHQKAELLKDILAFANGGRRTTAYILIGVREVRGGRSEVVGIRPEDHLHDHQLQEFVNAKSNRPVNFRYFAYSYRGEQIGVLEFGDQQRPVYLAENYLPLQAERVYIRRGSSTQVASPEEVAQMGPHVRDPAPQLTVEFADVAREQPVGRRIELNPELCHMPTFIPLLPEDRSLAGLASMERINREYLRDLALYEEARRLYRPLRLLIRNIGRTAAANVRLELDVPHDLGTKVQEEYEMPDVPARSYTMYIPRHLPTLGLGGVRNGAVDVTHHGDRWRVETEWPNLQPQRQVVTEEFFIGIRNSGLLSMRGRLLADSLPAAHEFDLAIEATVAESRLTLDDLRSLNVPEES